MRNRSAVHVRLLVFVSALAIAVLGTPTVASADHQEGHQGRHATADLVTQASPPVSPIGTVNFEDLDYPEAEGGEGFVLVSVEIDEDSGLDPGFHGFHIHMGDQPCDLARPDFIDVGGHYDGDGDNVHGDHAGDLPVLYVDDDGSALAAFLTDRITIEEIDGRAVIIHAGPDNYANIPADRYVTADGQDPPDEKTAATGDAGARAACGDIQEVDGDGLAEQSQALLTDDALTAVLTDRNGGPVGLSTFGDLDDDSGFVAATVSFVTFGEAGFHGHHVHAGNRCQFEHGAFDFSYALGHLGSGEDAHAQHAGDLPVLLMPDDEAGPFLGAFGGNTTDRLTRDDVKARTVIVHEDPDNYANIPDTDGDGNRYDHRHGGDVPDQETLAGGDSGQRLACGMIEGLVRLWGTERIQTAVRISQDSFLTDGTAEAAVLARADRFPDALAGVPLAEHEGGPILLTRTHELADQTADELQRVLPGGSTVYLLGGTHAISDDVAAAVEDLGYTVRRLQGETRFETGTAIADELDATHDTIFVTTGVRWPDAVSAGGAAAQEDAVIVFSAGDSPHPSTDAYLSQHQGEDVFAIGGPAARAYPDAEDVVGADRNETSVAVARTFFPNGPTYVGLARDGASGGDDDDAFADALTGGVHVGRLGGTMLLVGEDVLPDPVGDYLRENADVIEREFAYGGVVAISEDVATAAEEAANDAGGFEVQGSSDPGGSTGGSLLQGLLEQRTR